MSIEVRIETSAPVANAESANELALDLEEVLPEFFKQARVELAKGKAYSHTRAGITVTIKKINQS